jgi:hypothetical protein
VLDIVPLNEIMKKNISVFIAALLAAFVVSCDYKKEEEECRVIEIAGVVQVEIQDTAVSGSEVPLSISFGVHNGCGQYYRLLQNTDLGYDREFQVQAVYDGCTCTQDAPIRQVSVPFKAFVPGTYTLKFKSEDGSFVIKSLVLI